jgi:hypothetical protein
LQIESCFLLMSKNLDNIDYITGYEIKSFLSSHFWLNLQNWFNSCQLLRRNFCKLICMVYIEEHKVLSSWSKLPWFLKFLGLEALLWIN